ncbi:unnamed protein product [Mesocestoides corti]|uniref:Rho-GAP domain-containing protein n=1 Tax=Mesocestoides corti TaxID=53468 RepID=A0A158QVJ4_MESCO|nr:unnamed protein product [Mesocestoides corti]
MHRHKVPSTGGGRNSVHMVQQDRSKIPASGTPCATRHPISTGYQRQHPSGTPNPDRPVPHRRRNSQPTRSTASVTSSPSIQQTLTRSAGENMTVAANQRVTEWLRSAGSLPEEVEDDALPHQRPSDGPAVNSATPQPRWHATRGVTTAMFQAHLPPVTRHHFPAQPAPPTTAAVPLMRPPTVMTTAAYDRRVVSMVPTPPPPPMHGHESAFTNLLYDMSCNVVPQQLPTGMAALALTPRPAPRTNVHAVAGTMPRLSGPFAKPPPSQQQQQPVKNGNAANGASSPDTEITTNSSASMSSYSGDSDAGSNEADAASSARDAPTYSKEDIFEQHPFRPNTVLPVDEYTFTVPRQQAVFQSHQQLSDGPSGWALSQPQPASAMLVDDLDQAPPTPPPRLASAMNTMHFSRGQQSAPADGMAWQNCEVSATSGFLPRCHPLRQPKKLSSCASPTLNSVVSADGEFSLRPKSLFTPLIQAVLTRVNARTCYLFELALTHLAVVDVLPAMRILFQCGICGFRQLPSHLVGVGRKRRRGGWGGRQGGEGSVRERTQFLKQVLRRVSAAEVPSGRFDRSNDFAGIFHDPNPSTFHDTSEDPAVIHTSTRSLISASSSTHEAAGTGNAPTSSLHPRRSASGGFIGPADAEVPPSTTATKSTLEQAAPCTITSGTTHFALISGPYSWPKDLLRQGQDRSTLMSWTKAAFSKRILAATDKSLLRHLPENFKCTLVARQLDPRILVPRPWNLSDLELQNPLILSALDIFLVDGWLGSEERSSRVDVSLESTGIAITTSTSTAKPAAVTITANIATTITVNTTTTTAATIAIASTTNIATNIATSTTATTTNLFTITIATNIATNTDITTTTTAVNTTTNFATNTGPSNSSFTVIQSFMGDRAAKLSKPDLASIIIQRAITTPGVRDELYAQLCKQTTGNYNADSLMRGWELLCICLYFFPPNKVFRDPLHAYLTARCEALSIGLAPSGLHTSSTASSSVAESTAAIRPGPSLAAAAALAAGSDPAALVSAPITPSFGVPLTNGDAGGDANSVEPSDAPSSEFPYGPWVKLSALHFTRAAPRWFMRSVAVGPSRLPMPLSKEELLHVKDFLLKPGIFGSSLEEMLKIQSCRFPSLRLPWIQVFLTEELLRLKGAKAEGIFRVSADQDILTAVRFQLEKLFEVFRVVEVTSRDAAPTYAIVRPPPRGWSQSQLVFAPEGNDVPSANPTLPRSPLLECPALTGAFELPLKPTPISPRPAEYMLLTPRAVWPGDLGSFGESSNADENSAFLDPHLSAALLKLWLREMATPLVPPGLTAEVFSAAVEADAFEKAAVRDGNQVSHQAPIDKCCATVRRLPRTNRRVLLYLIKLCQYLARPENASASLMDSRNLATVIAPNLFRSTTNNPSEMLNSVQSQTAFVRLLICHLNVDAEADLLNSEEEAASATATAFSTSSSSR